MPTRVTKEPLFRQPRSLGWHINDNSHTCLRKDQVDEFHQHLNSMNANIQFTLELEDIKGQGLPFLDTITTRSGTQLEVNVHRKPTHTDRYLDFISHHPMCHKRSVVSTLLRRAQNILSTQKGKTRRNEASQGCTARQ